jgi:hypothetical protein
MRQNPNEGDSASRRIDKPTVGEAGAETEGPQLNSELLRALAASVDWNERMRERFRVAVVRRLARLDARAPGAAIV